MYHDTSKGHIILFRCIDFPKWDDLSLQNIGQVLISWKFLRNLHKFRSGKKFRIKTCRSLNYFLHISPGKELIYISVAELFMQVFFSVNVWPNSANILLKGQLQECYENLYFTQHDASTKV